MSKGANHLIQTPQGQRYVTPRAWSMLKQDKRYSLISVEGEVVEEPKKKEVVNDADDHKEVVFNSIDDDIDEISQLRDEYEELSGKAPHKLWKEKTLKTKIEELK